MGEGGPSFGTQPRTGEVPMAGGEDGGRERMENFNRAWPDRDCGCRTLLLLS